MPIKEKQWFIKHSSLLCGGISGRGGEARETIGLIKKGTNVKKTGGEALNLGGKEKGKKGWE